MPLIYVTGTSGTGKSTVLRKFQDKGYRAFGTDEHGYSQWINRRSGEVDVPPEDFDLHDWYKEHEWMLDPNAIAELRRISDDSGETTYLFGVAAGLEAVQRYFNLLIVLTANADTLKERILKRKDNTFGKEPNELKIILEWQQKQVDNYRKQGAIIVDTTDISSDKVVEKVLKVCESRLQ